MTQYTGKNFRKDVYKLIKYAEAQITKSYIRWGFIEPSILKSLEEKVQKQKP